MHPMAHNHKTPYNCIDVRDEDLAGDEVNILTPTRIPWYLFGKVTRDKKLDGYHKIELHP